jgi:alcohol dehydrogenase
MQVGLLLGDQSNSPVPMGRTIARELEIVGVHGMPARDYPQMLEFIASGKVEIGRLVGRVIGLDEAPAALMAMSRPPARSGMTVVELGR